MTPETILGNIISGVVGGLVVALASHFLSKQRESRRDQEDREHSATTARQDRMRDFIAFMEQLSAEAVQKHFLSFGKFYENKIPNLRHAASLVVGDLPLTEIAAFESILSAACDLSENEIYQPGNNKQIIEKVDKIILFAKDLPK